ncbi:hypothetical protein K32_20360 [Kaistia sp. 32K]|nr:hypothetical protein K32_20360 [Kaistia sp. 32K]
MAGGEVAIGEGRAGTFSRTLVHSSVRKKLVSYSINLPARLSDTHAHHREGPSEKAVSKDAPPAYHPPCGT